MSARKAGIGLVVTALVVVAVVIGIRKATHKIDSLLPDPEECTATVAEHTATLDPEQAGNAGLIAAIAVQRGLPARAATIAIATAMQESKLYNLASGDRDSLGLFQQRPSQGWGSAKQVLNPTYAINAFYDALVRIDGYETMEITKAAQEVQHSAYPEAYAQHEPDARSLASSLTGWSPHTFSCRLDEQKTGSGRGGALRTQLQRLYGDLVGSPTLHGSTLTVAIPAGKSGRIDGWSLAQYSVARAKTLRVASVSYAGRRWTADSAKGWVSDDDAGSRRVTISLA
ncbi:MAG: hypothetical protein QM638_17640 [Nocardioides sp.]|uniref:hypothetical protein n=1 Tax=Nocardioides sp. TaxID=35761 RepID=UPI0039E45C47